LFGSLYRQDNTSWSTWQTHFMRNEKKTSLGDEDPGSLELMRIVR
jgi:hypothetical protein